MILLGFRRKLTALTLCKLIESAIQWFQIHHRITFATIRNPTVYHSGARVSIFSTLVPRLAWMSGYSTLLHNIALGKYIVIKVEYGLQLHFKIFLNKSDRKNNKKIIKYS